MKKHMGGLYFRFPFLFYFLNGLIPTSALCGQGGQKMLQRSITLII
jgi:hypothetical protein